MIKNKKYLRYSIILFVMTLILNFRFPNESPFVETILSSLRIPVSVNGFQYSGMFAFLILILSLAFLSKSLEKFQTRFVLLALFLASVTPSYVASAYQKTLASGIYAVNYERNESHCEFEMTDELTLHGSCELPFENYSDKNVQFALEFYETHMDEEDVPMLTLMNVNGPYVFNLGGGERKRIKIETDIDVSKMENHIDSGEANGITIIIEYNGKSRKL